MSKFLALDNLTKQSLAPCEPWTFVPTENITEQIRSDKQARQAWYQNGTTRHCFYTCIEPTNPNQRVSKSNSPRLLHGLAVEYDAPISDSRVLEALSGFKIKPQWYERSLGGNIRLIWSFERPLMLDSYDFAAYLLDRTKQWLRLDMLPALDAGALSNPTRLLCCGKWIGTGASAISNQELQSFYVDAAKEFRFNSTDECNIPLDIVEKAVREKFQNFNWPSDFTLESQGASFWISESTSPMSAIVKPNGMLTFSAHATKPFYDWSEILGVDFTKRFSQTAIASATENIYWDGKNFWKQEQGRYVDLALPELTLYFKVDCRLSTKPGKGGVSSIDTALRHIQSANRIAGAAPFVFYPPGVFEYQGERKLNICMAKVLPPSDIGAVTWGAEGNFPWLSAHFDGFFDPVSQLPFFLAWWKAFYESGYYMKPMPGQNIFLMGGANVGKTMTSHAIIGKSVGGFMDAAKHLTTNSDFNSELPAVPLWTIDDETMGESPKAQANFAATWKKAAANQEIRCHKKYGIPVMTVWMGRILATSNLDAVSSRILGPMDNNSLDKTSLFRCASECRSVFPNRHELVQIIERELPYFMRWLLNWQPPEEVARDVRYGYKSYHEESLLDKAHQSGKAAPFKELLVESLENIFNSDPKLTEWRGSVTQILRMLQSNPLNETVIRTLRLEQTSRYLESLQREGILQCRAEMGPLKTRIWVFPRFNQPEPSPVEISAPVAATNTISIFTK